MMTQEYNLCNSMIRERYQFTFISDSISIQIDPNFGFFKPLHLQLHHCHQGRNRRQVSQNRSGISYYHARQTQTSSRYYRRSCHYHFYPKPESITGTRLHPFCRFFFIEWREIVSSETSAVRISPIRSDPFSNPFLAGIVDFGRLTQAFGLSIQTPFGPKFSVFPVL